MRIIFNYCFIFAPCICNSYFSNRYILNDPFSNDRIFGPLLVTFHTSGSFNNCSLSEYLFLLWATMLSLNNLHIMVATSIGPMHFQIVAATTIACKHIDHPWFHLAPYIIRSNHVTQKL